MSDLLYGHGTAERIVAIEVVPEKSNTVQIWTRDENDNISSRYEVFENIVYVNHNDPVLDGIHDPEAIVELGGTNFYDTMVQSDDYRIIKHVRSKSEDFYAPLRQAQWMVQNEETLFKGMDFDDPLRLYLDIETYTEEGYEFSNASRESDVILCIGFRTNRDEEFIFALDDEGVESRKRGDVFAFPDERELLLAFVEEIQSIDPDVITMHNGFGFDWPYIIERCDMHDVKLKIGRDGSVPKTFSTTIKFADKSDDYINTQVYGRHLTDTMFLAKAYDVVARKLDNYQLKYCAKFLGKIPDDRQYIPGDEISDWWVDPERTGYVLDYLFDDCEETQILDQAWGGAIFQMTQMIPLPLQDVARYGTGTKIDLIFNRAYYRYSWSWPKPDKKRNFGGGYANTYKYGVCREPTVYVDVSSLYPTLGELLKIQPVKDELGLYPIILKDLKQARYDIKYKARELSEAGRKEEAAPLKAKDGSIKILLNTQSYGWLGWEYGAFNDYDQAEKITIWGQKIIKKMVEISEKYNGTCLKVDTDGALVIVPEEYRGTQETETEFIAVIEQELNEWLETVL